MSDGCMNINYQLSVYKKSMWNDLHIYIIPSLRDNVQCIMCLLLACVLHGGLPACCLLYNVLCIVDWCKFGHNKEVGCYLNESSSIQRTILHTQISWKFCNQQTNKPNFTLKLPFFEAKGQKWNLLFFWPTCFFNFLPNHVLDVLNIYTWYIYLVTIKNIFLQNHTLFIELGNLDT